MKGQSPEMQEKIGKTLADLGMTMGIFVRHGDFGQGVRRHDRQGGPRAGASRTSATASTWPSA